MINRSKIFSSIVTQVSFCLIMLSSCLLFSQKTTTDKKVDSLISLLPTDPCKLRNKYLHDIVVNAKNTNANVALKYGRTLDREIRNQADSKLKAKSFCLLAEVFDQSGIATDSVKILCQKCLEIGKKLGHKQSEANALYRLGTYYRGQAEFETALECYHKAIEIQDYDRYKKTQSNCLHAIGVIKDYQQKFDEAIEYFNKSKEIGFEINDLDALFISYQSCAISRFKKGETKEAIKDFLKAKKYAQGIVPKIEVRSNISYAYSQINNLDSAYHYLIESNDLANKYGSARQKISGLNALISFHTKQNEWDKVFAEIKKREVLINEGKNKKWLRTNAADHVKYYKQKGDYQQAFEHQTKFITYNDSILNEKNQYAIKELEEKYENEKKQTLIEDQEKEIKNKNIQRNLFLTIGLLGILFLLHRIRKNKQIERQNEIINQKEIDKLKKENTIINLSSMLEGQHAERKRIAQDLHDGIGTLLSSAKLQLSNVKTELKKLEEMAVFSNAENLIENAYKEVRRISHDMMPGALVKLGLQAAVEDLAAQINESNKLLVQTQWFIDDSDMDDKTKVSLYFIIQEAVTNAVKYAEANNLIIQFSKNQEFYQLTIEDNGKGFNSKDKSNYGMGLKNIESRVDYLNGEWEIISTEGEGVSIEISVPVNA